MYIPARYFPAALNMQDMSPQQFWEVIMPQIWAHNKVKECHILGNWMRAAVTLANVRVPCSQPLHVIQTVIVLKPSLVVPAVDVALHIRQQERIINRDLTNQFQQDASTGAAIMQV